MKLEVKKEAIEAALVSQGMIKNEFGVFVYVSKDGQHQANIVSVIEEVLESIKINTF